ncbi:uncharacterized protein MYCFIDRAFT_146214, partial [Pseudocercospora fijiensis CIRAD86]
LVYTLIFSGSNVLNVAKIGEGKSLVFTAFTYLTSLITLYFTLLNRLSEE